MDWYSDKAPGMSLLAVPAAAAGYVLLVAAWCFLSNAGYAYWDGGFSTGPRHFTPA